MKLLTPIFVLIISIAIFVWFINPIYDEIKVVQAEQSKFEDALLDAKDAGIRWNNLVTASTSIKAEDNAKLNTLLPDKVDTIKLVVDLNALAAKYKTDIKNIRVGTDPSAQQNKQSSVSAYTAIPLGFTISLTYDNFLLFVRDLEKMLKLVDVSSVNFRPGEKATYDYSLNLNTYWLK